MVGISAVSGNVGLEHTYPNARNICHLVGARYPVYKGADRPLYAEVEHASYVHGEEGLGGARLESSPALHESEAAWDALYRTAVEYGGELQVLAVGPLTNIAIALAKYPALKTLIKRLLADGKSVQEIGKQLGMKPEEVFRLSDFSRDDFLSMMTKGVHGYSKAELLTKY